MVECGVVRAEEADATELELVALGEVAMDVSGMEDAATANLGLGSLWHTLTASGKQSWKAVRNTKEFMNKANKNVLSFHVMYTLLHQM